MRLTLAAGLLFAAGCVLLAGVNYGILQHVEANRKGQPNARLWLTERELPLIDSLEFENSGRRLRLVWRFLDQEIGGKSSGTPSWLNSERLHQLGFTVDLSVPAGQRKHWPAESRQVYVVFEQNGAAYLEAMQRAERFLARVEASLKANPADKSLQASVQQAKKSVRAEETSLSRLFAIDAGIDPLQLKQLYNNPSRYIIAPGVIRLQMQREENRTVVSGHIDSISLDSIHVPLEFRTAIDRIIARHKQPASEAKLPRYAVLLSYGNHWEPWIDAVRPAIE